MIYLLLRETFLPNLPYCILYSADSLIYLCHLICLASVFTLSQHVQFATAQILFSNSFKNTSSGLSNSCLHITKLLDFIYDCIDFKQLWDDICGFFFNFYTLYYDVDLLFLLVSPPRVSCSQSWLACRQMGSRRLAYEDIHLCVGLCRKYLRDTFRVECHLLSEDIYLPEFLLLERFL